METGDIICIAGSASVACLVFYLAKSLRREIQNEVRRKHNIRALRENRAERN
jgi:hypothetical protein